MKRKKRNKEAAHLQRKLLLYESFLYRYLPQISSVSHISRLNIFDLSGRNGLNKQGTQGSPFVIFKALQKQRQHQLKKKLTLKPFSLSLISLREQTSFNKAIRLLSELNIYSNTCRLESLSSNFPDGIKKIISQSRQQAGSERNLIFLDPSDAESLSLPDLKLLSGIKAEVILYLPVKSLWLMHTIGEKAIEGEVPGQLKESLDQLLPDNHPYWSEEVSQEDFFIYIKEAFRLEGDFFTAMEPSGTELAEGALLALSSGAYMMEKVLLSLQALRHENTTPPGEQIPLFASGDQEFPKEHHHQTVLELLKEDYNNQQLYKAGIQAGVLPRQLMAGLSTLIEEEQIEILDIKGKPLKELPPNSISFTACKAAGPVCFLRKRNEKFSSG